MVTNWKIRFAIRDSHGQFASLLLLVVSAALGTALLVSLSSFKQQLEVAIEQQAKPLLGADISIDSTTPFTDAVQSVIAEFPGRNAKEASFASMLFIPKGGSSRLVQIVALEGEYPFYGELKTEPPTALDAFRRGEGVILDRQLLLQYGISIGDLVRVGTTELSVLGAVVAAPGSIDFRSAIAPRAYIPYGKLEQTGLVKKGSRIRYQQYFELPANFDLSQDLEQYRPKLISHGARLVTYKDRSENIRSSMMNTYRFLDLAAFVSVLIGCIGIGMATQAYLRQKVRTVAILRCLGANPSDVLYCYLTQLCVYGAIGVSGGVALGIIAQSILPDLFKFFVPLSIEPQIAWRAVIVSAVLCLVLLVLFTLPSLLPLRLIGPLSIFRSGSEEALPKDRARWLVYLAIVAVSTAGIAVHVEKGSVAAYFVGGTVAIGLTLWLLARALGGIVRRLTPHRAPFSIRQGIANVYRPNNQSNSIMLAVGMAAYVLLCVLLLQRLVLAKIERPEDQAEPNLLIFEVQPDQISSVHSRIDAQGAAVLDSAPVIAMRILALNDTPIAKIAKDRGIPDWTLRREYRSTYRAALTPGETLLSGTFVAQVTPETDGSATSARVPITLEKDIAQRLQVAVGSTIDFDVQGVTLYAVVSGIRNVNWQQLRANFFLVFPEGVLEGAPQFSVLSTRTPTEEISARLQREIVQEFPNISILDLSLVLGTLDVIFEKIAGVVKFLGGACLIAVVLVLIIAVRNSRSHRIKECGVLRALGASRAQVFFVIFAEYVVLGLFASGAAAILGYASALVFAERIFDISARPVLLPALASVPLVTMLVAVVGSIGAISITNVSPLVVLRRESE